MQEININIINNKSKPKYQPISDELRQMIINKMKSGLTAQETGDTLNVKPNTCHHIYYNYRKTGLIGKQSKGHRQQKLSENRKQMICGWVDDNCPWI